MCDENQKEELSDASNTHLDNYKEFLQYLVSDEIEGELAD